MSDRDATSTGPGPGASDEPSTGLADPREALQGPEVIARGEAETGGLEINEAPDDDPPAWKGPDPEEGARGLVDPRSEGQGPVEP